MVSDSSSRMLSTVLKILAPVFLAVSVLHLGLGLGAEVMLGAAISDQALSDAVLDSQNRFYGVAFGLYGVMLFICAGDLKKYQTILRALLWVFFAAGAARFVSIVTHGLPAIPVLVLLGSELLMPPVLLRWLRHALSERSPS